MYYVFWYCWILFDNFKKKISTYILLIGCATACNYFVYFSFKWNIYFLSIGSSNIKCVLFTILSPTPSSGLACNSKYFVVQSSVKKGCWRSTGTSSSRVSSTRLRNLECILETLGRHWRILSKEWHFSDKNKKNKNKIKKTRQIKRELAWWLGNHFPNY